MAMQIIKPKQSFILT